ncbi:MAG: haloacid dehalogenase, partial [Candidatus Omnitrophica bacterium]|nr:haloacid dehalogenase [Candidatus Omnitrophota bacterium]
MSQKVKAIFFDAGGTLFRPYPSVGEIYARTAFAYGMKCDPDVLEREFQLAWQKRGGLSSLGRETSEVKERSWWYTLVEEVFASHGGVPN